MVCGDVLFIIHLSSTPAALVVFQIESTALARSLFRSMQLKSIAHLGEPWIGTSALIFTVT